jgi:hypothetical protein
MLSAPDGRDRGYGDLILMLVVAVGIVRAAGELGAPDAVAGMLAVIVAQRAGQRGRSGRWFVRQPRG